MTRVNFDTEWLLLQAHDTERPFLRQELGPGHLRALSDDVYIIVCVTVSFRHLKVDFTGESELFDVSHRNL